MIRKACSQLVAGAFTFGLLAAALSAQSALSTTLGSTDNGTLGASLAGGAFGASASGTLAIGEPGRNVDTGRVRLEMSAGGSLVLDGSASGDRFGEALALGGDADGGGDADLAVGAPGATVSSDSERGRITMIAGEDLGSGRGGTTLWTATGDAANERFGAALAFIGDLDADGQDDLIVGIPGHAAAGGTLSGAGRVLVLSGATGLPIAGLDAQGTAAGDALGSAVANVGDLDGDGLDDFAAGAPGATGAAGVGAGTVTLFSGADGSTLLPAALEGSQAGAAFGSALSPAGDRDLDGVPDFAIGAPGFDAGVAGVDTDAGRALVLSGRDTAITLLEVSGAAGDACGSALAAQDLDGDGVADLLVGEPGHDGAGSDRGRVRAFSATSSTPIVDLVGTNDDDARGSALAGLGLRPQEPRVLFAVGDPLIDLAGSDRGQVTTFAFDGGSAAERRAFDGATQTLMTKAADLDGDGDADLLALGLTELRILWNGDHDGAPTLAAFATLAPTTLSLSAGANATSFAVGELDSDAAPEIVIGRADGTLSIWDGSGSGASTAFALAANSPYLIDPNGVPGSVAAVAIYGSGPSAAVFAGGGALGQTPYALRIDDALAVAPMIAAPFSTVGPVAAIAVTDLDGDSDQDLLVLNAVEAPSGTTGSVDALLVYEGPTLTAATGLGGTLLGFAPSSLSVLDVDGDGIASDVAVGGAGLLSGGVKVLLDHDMSTGFASILEPDNSITSVVALASGDGDDSAGDELFVATGTGPIRRFGAFTTGAFVSDDALPFGNASTLGNPFSVTVAELEAGIARDAGSDELITSFFGSSRVGVLRERVQAVDSVIGGTGCVGSLTAAGNLIVSQRPVLGVDRIDIRLESATPFSFAFLLVYALPEGASVSMVTPGGSGCGVALPMIGPMVAPSAQYRTFTDANGDATLLSGAPAELGLLGSSFTLQWGVLDGGPLRSGAVTASDGREVVFGEY